MDIEDIQAEERYEAVDGLTDSLIAGMKRQIEERGGDGEEFIKWLSRGEVIGEIFEAIFAAMPNHYGVKTKRIYHQSTIDDLTRHI